MVSLTQRAFLSLLSGPDHRPAACQFIPAAEPLESLLQHPSLSELCAQLPCLLAADDAARLPPEQVALLQAAGIKLAEAGAIGNHYQAGRWFLQALPGSDNSKVASRPMALKLAQLVATDADNHAIEEVFRHEPTLSYHLIRLVNSPGISNGRRIDSFTQAIMVLGRRQLRRWLNLILFASSKNDPRSAMLLAHVTARARTMEQLAHTAGFDKEQQERAFMVGMFSLLGVMFGMDLAAVIEPLKLESSLNEALLAQSGDLGRLLAAADAIEQGDSATVIKRLSGLLPADSEIDILRIEALLWTLTLLKESEHG
jgi:EAL and modified HD-GYP domain-containing signal transduction protein